MISQDKNFFQSIPKDSTIFYWIPIICNLLKSKSEIGEVKAIIDIAKKEIKKIMLSITNVGTNDIRNKYLLKMLPSIDESEILRNNEMLCYQKSLKLLEEYNSIDNIFANIGKLDDRIRQKFEASKDVLDLAQELIKLRFDAVDIDTMDDFRTHLDNDNLSKFITKYGFRDIDSDARRFGSHSNAVKEKQVEEQKGLF